MRTPLTFLAAICLTPAPGVATDYVWLIGGGPSLEESQAQIEQNVIWARDVISHAAGDRVLRVYFTDGADPAKDVTEWKPSEETAESLQPLARVLNSYWSNGELYRNHRLGEVAGGTEAGFLRAELARDLQRLKPGDRALVVFNGHGGYDGADTSHNTIALWNDTEMTVDDTDALLSRLHPEVSLRFIFTQCYSGAFARLAAPGKDWCGFLAEADDRPAEGCSASVDIGDYRDYSTFFFAALAGKDRQETPLTVNADRNGDGSVSLREAHLYALLAGRSSDLPRSTSEVYLEDWTPWYLRWPAWSPKRSAPNEYDDLVRELVQREGIESGKMMLGEIRSRRRDLETEASRLSREQTQLVHANSKLRLAMQEELFRRWPEARNAYTNNHRRFLERDLSAAQQFILSDPRYAELSTNQDKYWELERALVNNERALTQLEKIQWIAQLARTRALFERFASDEQQQTYKRLLACEDQSL